MLRRNFDENGDYAINSFCSQSQATIQAVTTRLRLFLGEWFLNLDSGVPWYQRVLRKPERLADTEQIIRETILQTIGVDKLVNFDLVFDKETRKVAVRFTATTIYGDEYTDVIGLSPIGG